MSALGEKLYPVTEEEKQCVRQYYGKSEEEIKNDCDIIRRWMKQQMHLPDDYDCARVERFLLRNKFRVEHAKKKLENYYTVRGANIKWLRNMDPDSKDMQNSFRTVSLVPMPKLYNNEDRIYVVRFTGNDNDFSLKNSSLLALALLEMELCHEYAVGIHFINDFSGFNLAHMKTMDVNQISKSYFMIQECLSARILSIHYINAPPIFNTLLKILKLALPEKLYEKIKVHKSLDSLRKDIPAECLPSDFGGKLRSTNEIHEDVKQFLKESREHLLNRAEVVSDESKRVGDVGKNDIFGADGSFKKINLG